MKIKIKFLNNFLLCIKEIIKKNNQDISISFNIKYLLLSYKNDYTCIYCIGNFHFLRNENYFIDYVKIYSLTRCFNKESFLDFSYKHNRVFLSCNNFSYIFNKKYKKNYKQYVINLPRDIKNSATFKNKNFLKALKYNIHNIKKFNNKETGLNIVIKSKKIILFSTDGFTISFYSFNHRNSSRKLNFNLSRSITKSIIMILSKYCKKNILINFSDNFIYFFVDNICIKTKEYKEINISYKIFNFKNFINIKVLLIEFKKIIKLFKGLLINNYIDLIFKKKYIFFTAFNELNEKIVNKIKIKDKIKKKIKIRYNINYLIDFLKLSGKKKKFYIYYKKKFEKTFFRYENSKYIKLIMPIYY
ncbi:hypothetical protein ACWNYI_00585 [Candidatus Vidania fulgoroideorum]